MELNRDKQIEEMASEIHNLIRSTAVSRALASLLYDKGYCKATDVALKVIGEVEATMGALDRRYMTNGQPKQSWGVRGALAEIAELKRKYREDERGNGNE